MYYEGLIPTDIVRYKKHKLINISDKAEAKLASSFDYMHNEQVSPEYATLYYNRLKTSFASDSANDTVVFTPYSTFNVSNSLTREAAEQTAWYIHHSGKTRMNNAYKTKEGIQTLNANLVILNPTQRTIDFAAGVSPMLVRQVVEQLTKYDDIEYYHVLYDGADIGTVGNVNSNSVFDDNSTFSKIYKYANSPANVNVLLTYSDIQSAKKPKTSLMNNSVFSITLSNLKCLVMYLILKPEVHYWKTLSVEASKFKWTLDFRKCLNLFQAKM